MRIEYHRTLIADRVRNAALYKALQRVIVPGKSVVADVGAGTGLLGLMAAKLGAKDVYLFEAGEVAGVAGQMLKANKARNCHLIPCHSTEFADKLQADVIVSETLGNYAFEENIIDTLNDARARFLKPGGIVIPQSVEQFVAPVISDRIHRELTVWDGAGFDIDFAAARTMSLNNVYVRALKPADLFEAGKSAKSWDRVDLTKPAKSSRKGEAAWTMKAEARIYGFAVWWEVSLIDGVTLSTAPGAPATHWEQLYFPLMAPIEAKAGDSVTISLRSRSSEAAGTHLGWTAVHSARGGKVIARHAHDLDKGWIP